MDIFVFLSKNRSNFAGMFSVQKILQKEQVLPLKLFLCAYIIMNVRQYAGLAVAVAVSAGVLPHGKGGSCGCIVGL